MLNTICNLYVIYDLHFGMDGAEIAFYTFKTLKSIGCRIFIFNQIHGTELIRLL